MNALSYALLGGAGDEDKERKLLPEEKSERALDRMTPEWREGQLGLVGRRFNALEKMLEGKPYVMGENFSVADAYLFTVLNWTHVHKIDVSKWPNIKAYMARVAARTKGSGSDEG